MKPIPPVRGAAQRQGASGSPQGVTMTFVTRLLPLALVAAVVLGFSGFFSGNDTPPADRALRAAFEARDLTAAREAIAAGANVNATDAGGSRLLHSVAWAGDLPMARLLVEQGAEVDAADWRSGETPLHSAARGNQPEVAAYLLREGADPDARTHAPIEQCNGEVFPAGVTAADIARQAGFGAVERVID